MFQEIKITEITLAEFILEKVDAQKTYLLDRMSKYQQKQYDFLLFVDKENLQSAIHEVILGRSLFVQMLCDGLLTSHSHCCLV